MEILEHKDLTPFEYACQLGNLSSLKLILSHQAPLENNPIYFNGLMLSIEYNQTEIIQHLLQYDIYQEIIEKNQLEIMRCIQEHGHFHILEQLDDILEPEFYQTQIQLPLEELHQHSVLDIPEQIVLKELSAYYQSSICQQTFLQHLNDIKDQLAHHYQQNPIEFDIDDQKTIHLPLSFESFLILKFQYSETIQQKMIQAYLQHPTHSAWRLFLNHNPWSRQHTQLNNYYSEIKWLIILMWFVAHDKQLITKNDVKDTDERITLFISELAGLQHCSTTPQALQKYLLNAVIGHPMNQILNAEQLHVEQQNFLQHHWNHYFKKMHYEEILHTKLEWTDWLLNPQMEPPQRIKACQLTENENQLFEEMMTQKWGSRWSDNQALVKDSRQKLLSSNMSLAFHQYFQSAVEKALEMASSSYYGQFKFFYHESQENVVQTLDHHHKINEPHH